jgi:hypothetical protein
LGGYVYEVLHRFPFLKLGEKEKEEEEEEHSQRFLCLPPHYATINTITTIVDVAWFLAHQTLSLLAMEHNLERLQRYDTICALHTRHNNRKTLRAPVLLMLKGPLYKWKVIDNKDFITLAYVVIF